MYSFAMLICVNVVDADTTGSYNVKHRKLLLLNKPHKGY
nr:MAG TPA: hypothetical protein [Caudoviricetes sp.]